MSTKQTTVDFILEQITDAGVIFAKKMFGEYGLYCDGKMVALICDDELFIKVTEAGQTLVGDYKGAKPCLFISGEKWENSKWLSNLIKISAAQLPMPKKRSTVQRKKNNFNPMLPA